MVPVSIKISLKVVKKKKKKKEGMLCASFKIKIEFEGWVKIVDELKRLKRVNIYIKNKNKIHQNGYTLTHHQKKDL